MGILPTPVRLCLYTGPAGGFGMRPCCPPVPRPRVILLTSQQARQPEDWVWGPGMVILFLKPADQEDGDSSPKGPPPPGLGSRLLLY